jgi:outer membrane protein OmpA-like peptidoglycan-associated protein
MKFAPLHASLMSLALFALAGPAVAAAPETEKAIILAQAETPAAEPEQPQAEAEQPPPPEVQQEAQPEPQPEPQQEAAPEPQPEPQQEAAPEPAPQESSEVALFLQSVRPAAELSEEELRRQMQQAMALAETEGLSKDQRRALRDVIREARAELKNKAANEAAETQTPPETPPESPPETQQQAEPQPQPQPQTEEPPVAEQQQAEPPVVEQPPQEQKAKAVDVDPALEAEARALLDDTVDVREMKRRELRKRLATMRDLLASERLSPETREALRKRLAEDREVLRSDVSRTEAETNQTPAQIPAQTPDSTAAGTGTGTGTGTVNNNVIINNNTTITNTEIQVVLSDRRPPDQLEDDELLRRIDIYRDVVRDDRYDMDEREAWRRTLERDRRYLRRQMLEEREEREARLRRGEFEFNIEIYDDYDPGRDYQDDVFAAEVEDDELADVLAAPPRRKVERRYTVDEIERSSTARDTVARIEIDTVNFGFGEGFLREEEIDKLDRIARVLERILAKNPDEVFLLEGHTDAVGSAGSNLQLSRERAAAVKEALTTYYVIPAENLRTAGLGERYLKIPTLQAEAENRRVSLARITSLVSQAD